MTVIELEDLTIDEMRQLRKIRLPTDMNKIINSNTYYRIIRKNFKHHPQKRSLEKLRVGLGVSEEIFDRQLENQWNSLRKVDLSE